jgi:hypothetical protein
VRQVLGKTGGTQMTWPFPPWDGPKPINNKEKRNEKTYPDDMPDSPFVHG